MLLQSKKIELIEQYKINELDTGSADVQCAILTEKISYLSKHLTMHKHDYSSKRGLLKMVNKRRRFLNYLRRTDKKRYDSLIQRLGLRDTAGKVKSR
jgi:small subunit ribosomal protein S15